MGVEHRYSDPRRMEIQHEYSQRLAEDLIRANWVPQVVQERQEWAEQRAQFGSVAVSGCIDPRTWPGVLDPHFLNSRYRGQVIELWSAFAGSHPKRHRNPIKTDTTGIVFLSHFSDLHPDADMGFGDCGARKIAHDLSLGVPVDIAARDYVEAASILPHYVAGPLDQALNASRTYPGTPCAAMTMNHANQLPHLLGVAKNGGLIHVAQQQDDRPELVPEIQPEDIEKEYPYFAAMVRAGREFAKTQEVKNTSIPLNPYFVWITHSRRPRHIIFGRKPKIGQIMRYSYARNGGNENGCGYDMREGEDKYLKHHLSYPLYMASHGKHGFDDTNLLMIDGKNEKSIRAVWRAAQNTDEAQKWLATGARVVMGCVMHAGNIVESRYLYR